MAQIAARIARSAIDRARVAAVARAANRVQDPLPWYAAARLAAPLRRRATWWLAEDAGEPVSALLCYPLSLRHEGVPVAGYGIGSVATLPEHRGQGHASHLLHEAIDHAEEGGAKVGVLFSAIPPGLYERLGFRVVPASGARCQDAAQLATSGDRAELVPLDPFVERARLRAAHDALTDGLRTARDAAAWDESLLCNPGDRFFAAAEGYVRLIEDDGAIEVVELCVRRPAAVLRAVAALAVALGRGRVEGWFEPPAELASRFSPMDRSRTLPMVRGPKTIRTAWLSSADYF